PFVFTLLAAVNSGSLRFQMEKATQMQRGLMARVILSIITLAAFLAGSLIFVGFYTSGYDLFQKIVVILVAMIIAFAVLAILWFRLFFLFEIRQIQYPNAWPH